MDPFWFFKVPYAEFQRRVYLDQTSDPQAPIRGFGIGRLIIVWDVAEKGEKW